MKTKSLKWLSVLSVLGLVLSDASGQDREELGQLKKQLEHMQTDFERVVREQRQQIEALQKQVEDLQARQAGERPVMATTSAPPAAPSETAAPAASASTGSPDKPVRVGKGSAYLDLGLVGTFAAGGSTARDIQGGTQLGGHDPNQRGFTVQGVEANFAGAVDPYFRGNVNVLFAVDSGGDSFFELEEAWLETVSLPGNLQLRAGQLLTDFGRVNTQHPHQWAFVDAPLAAARFLGPDGLRNPGVRVSWLVPTPFYSELFLAVQDSHGEGASSFRGGGHNHGREEEAALPLTYRHADNDRGVRGAGDLLFTPRYTMSFDLTDSQTLLVGASTAFGPNASGEAGDTATQIYGLDLYWKWKPARAHGGFPFVSFQAEGLVRRYEAGAFDWQEVAEVGGVPIMDLTTAAPALLPPETVTDYGFYGQMLYGFHKGWVAGLRYDYVTGERGGYERLPLTFDGEPLGRDPLRRQRWRLSPNLTWYPSEYSKLRLQYNYDDRADFGVDHSVWLQWELLLGAHAAHKF